MTFVFDLLGVQNRDHGERGIARYTLHLALALERQAPGLVDEYWVHAHLPIPGSLEPLIRTGRVKRKTVLERATAPSPAGLYLAGSMFELGEPLDHVVPPWARGAGWRSMAILYDLIPLRFADWYLTEPVTRFQYMTRMDATTSLDHLLSISQATANDATELLGVPQEKMTVIGAGADRRFRPPTEPLPNIVRQLQESIPDLEDNYVLFPSGIEPRKNIDGMLEAYAGLPQALRDKHQLVLVCRVNEHEWTILEQQAKDLGIQGRLVITGFVPDQALVQLYQAATLVVFPAIYEGFGLPVLEGMRCGAPVICSDSSSLKEIQLDQTALFDPNDVSDIAATMERFLADPAERQRLVDAEPSKFSWDLAATLTAEQARTMLPQPGQPSPKQLPTLALVSPLPPEASGIATYAHRFLAHLAKHFRVTVFTGPDGLEDSESLPAGVNASDIEFFDTMEQANGRFHHVLYFLGNSHFHVEGYELLKRRGGSVLLHDVRLTGLHNEIQRLAPERLINGSVGTTLAHMYPHRFQIQLEERAVIPADVADRFGVFMTKEVTDAADEVFVHSRFAADLLELDTGQRPRVLFDIPMIPEPAPETSNRSATQVCSFGLVDPAKMPERIIDAMIEVNKTSPDIELIFIGGLTSSYQRDLEARASAGSNGLQVTFTGHADEATYDRYLHSATVAVQLRSLSNGESSATLAENMAVGTPLVITNIGAQAELPDEIAIKVDPDVSGTELAEAILSIVTDPDRAKALSEAGRQRAQLWSYEAAAQILADQLIDSQS